MTTRDHLSLNEEDDTLNEEDDDDVQVRSKLLPNDTGQPNQYGTAVHEGGDDMVTKKVKKFNRRYISMVIMMFTMLVSSICFSIIFGSVWPYYQQVDHDATAAFLGYIVAACSFGQLLGAPVFGWWSNHRPVMEPVIVSLLISVGGSIFYTYAEAFDDDGKWVLLFSRLIIGIGTGNIAIARSYLAAASWENERSTVMSLLGATQGLGFILGPGFGLLFQPLGNEGVRWHTIQLHFNLYTGPGFFTAALCIFNIIVLILFFKEFNVHGTKRKKSLIELFRWCRQFVNRSEGGSKMSRMDTSGFSEINDLTVSVVPNPTKLLEKYDMVSAWACIVMFFLILIVFAVLETLLTPVGEDEYGWTQSKAAFYVNIILTVNSAIAIAAVIGTRILVKWIPERLVFMGGIVVMAMGFVIWLPYTGHPKIGGSHVDNNSSSNISDGFCDYMAGDNQTTIVGPGCNPEKQPWCCHQAKVYLFQYLTGLPIITIGFCASSILCQTIMSKILGPWPQGVMMGFISVSGSAGRAVGPLVLARIYHEAGPFATYLTCIGLTAVGGTILLIFFRRLIPYSVYIKKKKKRLYVKFDQDNDPVST